MTNLFFFLNKQICGDPLAWREEGFCVHHTGSNLDFDPTSAFTPDQSSFITFLLHCLVTRLLSEFLNCLIYRLDLHHNSHLPIQNLFGTNPESIKFIETNFPDYKSKSKTEKQLFNQESQKAVAHILQTFVYIIKTFGEPFRRIVGTLLTETFTNLSRDDHQLSQNLVLINSISSFLLPRRKKISGNTSSEVLFNNLSADDESSNDGNDSNNNNNNESNSSENVKKLKNFKEIREELSKEAYEVNNINNRESFTIIGTLLINHQFCDDLSQKFITPRFRYACSRRSIRQETFC